MENDPELEKRWPEAYAAIVEVTTGDGRTLSRRVDYAKRTTQDPLTPDEILGKYLKLATTVATPSHAQRIADLVTRIERATAARDLAALLRNLGRPLAA
jgi:2-methylcitrate dehydratase PrpD